MAGDEVDQCMYLPNVIDGAPLSGCGNPTV